MSDEESRQPGDPIDFVALYRTAFPDAPELAVFVDRVERAYIDPEQTYAKIALHQGCRMVVIADLLEREMKGRPALQIMFYVIAAETVAKLFVSYEGKRQSWPHVEKFFGELCDDSDRELLEDAFVILLRGKDGHEGEKMPSFERRRFSWKEAVRFLYDVRCDVAHRGHYSGLTLEKAGRIETFVPTPSGASLQGPVRVNIEAKDIRRMVLRGAMNACRRMLPEGVDT